MSLKDILERNYTLTMRDFQELQAEYDKRFVSDEFTGFNKIRHTYAHMGKLIGKLAEYIEAIEEGKDFSPEDLRTKVIPDLLVYSVWLAEELGVNVERAYLNRFISNIRRPHSDKISSGELDELNKNIEERIKRMK